jgi:hypothetical protein
MDVLGWERTVFVFCLAAAVRAAFSNGFDQQFATARRSCTGRHSGTADLAEI